MFYRLSPDHGWQTAMPEGETIKDASDNLFDSIDILYQLTDKISRDKVEVNWNEQNVRPDEAKGE